METRQQVVAYDLGLASGVQAASSVSLMQFFSLATGSLVSYFRNAHWHFFPRSECLLSKHKPSLHTPKFALTLV